MNLTLDDIKLVLQIIDVCGKRGAIAANEFTVVGALVDRLNQGVKQAAAEDNNKETDT